MLKMRHRPVGTREGDAVNLLSSSDQECLRQDLEMSQVMAHSPLNEFMALQDLLLFWMRVLRVSRKTNKSKIVESQKFFVDI